MLTLSVTMHHMADTGTHISLSQGAYNMIHDDNLFMLVVMSECKNTIQSWCVGNLDTRLSSS